MPLKIEEGMFLRLWDGDVGYVLRVDRSENSVTVAWRSDSILCYCSFNLNELELGVVSEITPCPL